MNQNQKSTKRDTITYIVGKAHQVDTSYIEFMLDAKIENVASSYGAYLMRLGDLKKILDVGHHLIIDTTEIKTLDELASYLTDKGFENIENDLIL